MDEPVWWHEDVPRRPGVYLFRNAEGRVIYVGKAVDLRSRLASYRRPGGDGRLAVRFLERDAQAVETIVTRTESEALLLEDTLIKQHRPIHNVRLKDDKSFLMLRLDHGEPFPRLKLVRAHSPRVGKPDGRSRLFGPYSSARSVRRTLADLHRIVPLRDCPDSVMTHRSRACLKQQIGQCCAPCVEGVTVAEYDAHVARAARILSGDTEELERDLDRRMRAASDGLDFERAALWRDRLGALRRTVEGQGVRPRDRVERDVLGLARRGDDALVYRLAFRGGRMSESRPHRFRSELPDEELLHAVVTAFYGSGRREVPRELVLPCRPAEAEALERALGEELEIVVPGGGERRRMLDLAGENARVELARLDAESEDGAELIEQVRRLLDLEQAPEVIDCFDVSNTQAAHTVASRVRFRRGIADRAGYRRFKLRELDGPDDFAAMREVVGRSLRRGVDEADLPDLVVVDGGRAQLDCGLAAREESGAWSVAMVGLAKARPARGRGPARRSATEERLFLPGVEEPLVLPRHSAVRHLFERVRNEAHRFAITYHRKERGRIQSRLDAIPGVGSVRRRALLRRFGSVGALEAASVEEIAGVRGIGAELARTVREHLREG
ncbi:MAG: excinuclease ABC subunit UvrC [Planctomycetota bacterium]|nr:excinuclease ABC subunit UvrC [Planctomycetota bacterium]